MEEEMPENANEMELKDRLDLIENMLSAGRRKTENWGWTFVLWAWPITWPLSGLPGEMPAWRGP